MHSEGVGIVSVWPPVIIGIDFKNDDFVYHDEIEKSVLDVGFLKVNLKSFFPYLTLNLFGREIMLSWVFYYTPFLMYILPRFIELFISIHSYSISVSFLLIVFFYVFSSLKLASVLFQNFTDKRMPKLIFLIFLVFSPSFYSLIFQFHHLQSAIFLNLFLAFLVEGRYKLSALAGGLTLYSYAPSVHLVIGAYIAEMFRTRRFKSLFLSLCVSISFLIPYIVHIKLAEKMVDYYKQVCQDCVFYNAYTELYKFFGGKIRSFSLDEIAPKIFGGLSQGYRCLEGGLGKLKSSFSLSDIYITYGFISQKSDLHFLSDIANTIIIVTTLIFGIVFFARKFETIFILISLFLFLSFDQIIPAVPKMLYAMLPVFSCLFVKILFRTEDFAKDLWFILVISMFLRILDVYNINNYYLPYIREKETKEAVDFVLQNDVKDGLYLFSIPIGFYLYSNGRVNPPLVLLAFHPGEKEDKLKIIRFLLKKSKYVLVDARFEDLFKEGAIYEKIKIDTVFKNQAYVLISVKR